MWRHNRELSTLLEGTAGGEVADGPRRRRMRTLDSWYAAATHSLPTPSGVTGTACVFSACNLCRGEPVDRAIAHVPAEELEAEMEEQRLAAMNARYFAESEIVDADHLPRCVRACTPTMHVIGGRLTRRQCFHCDCVRVGLRNKRASYLLKRIGGAHRHGHGSDDDGMGSIRSGVRV